MTLIQLTLALAALSPTLSLSFWPPAFRNQQPLQDQAVNLSFNFKPRIRNGTLADLDAITNVLVDAYSPAPEQEYIFQFRDQYSKYHWECMRQDVLDAFKQVRERDGVYFNVIDAPIEKKDVDEVGSGDEGDHGHPQEMKVVAIAAWIRYAREDDVEESQTSLPALFSSLYPDVGVRESKQAKTNCSLHLDMNITRAEHFSRQFSAYKDHYIETAYDKQVYLALLATHPDYDGRGFGAMHCEWGKELARRWGEELEEKVNVTLMATPPGYSLYSTIGFESVKNLSFTRVEGDKPKELCWQEVMEYEQ